MGDFTDEENFWEFQLEHHEDIDEVIKSMYLQWRTATKAGFIPVFTLPQAHAEEMPEDFRIEVIEKVDGAGVVRSYEEGKTDERFIWKVTGEGEVQVALHSKEEAEPLPDDVLDACTMLVREYYEGKTIEVNEALRDHYFTLYTGIK